MIFPSDSEVADYRNAISNIQVWSSLSQQYILNRNQELISTKRQVFFVEEQTFTPNKNKPDQVDLLVSSNECALLILTQNLHYTAQTFF